MYGIGGERDLTERTLDHLSGYDGAQPGPGRQRGLEPAPERRVGDAARRRRHPHAAKGQPRSSTRCGRAWPAWSRTALAHSGDPDQGIWEIRGDPQHFTASAVLCWVAADRGADLARRRGDTERADRWRKARRRAESRRSWTKGVDERGRFRQAYENDELDASLLLIPIMGFLPPDDERVRATVLAIADELTEDGLVLRYKVDSTDTGFEGKEGTFTICSWWLVSALAMIGEIDRARALCKKLLSFAGPLHLYAEEIDATTGEHLGNFPQAFTHLALIDAVSQLIEAEVGPT